MKTKKAIKSHFSQSYLPMTKIPTTFKTLSKKTPGVLKSELAL
jgi:hypothetical protein